VDGQGHVIYHSQSEYIGADFSAQPVVQHILDGHSGATRTLDFEQHDIVAGYTRVPGTAWGLVTEESWDALIAPLRGYQQFLLVLLGLGVVVPVIVVTFGVGRITRPIRALIYAAQEVADGNFGRKIAVTTNDELEDLAEQFNTMSAELQESYAHLEQRVADRTKELAALNAIATAVSGSLDLEEILDHALEKTLEVTGLDAGAAFRLDEESQTLILMAHRGLTETSSRQITHIPLAVSVAAIAAREGYPVVQPVAEYPDSTLREVLEIEDVQQVVGVPFVAKGTMVGALSLGSRSTREFSTEDLSLLAGIGRQVGVAVENARLHQETEQLAVMKERQRLARELHDSVTQSLYSLTLLAEAGRRLAGSGDTERVKTYLARLGETAQQALKEMRLLVYELRPLVLETEGLVGALQQRLDAVEKRAGVQSRLLVEGALDLPPGLEEGLYRIAQEALNNALKHAAASAVTVHICADGEGVRLDVTDNGEGFDPAAASDRGGLGFTSMRERAERLDGILAVRSAPGEGTTVSIAIGRQLEAQVEV
jgi:nitrate/nitrite-specific signal transduction histidine kinase